VGCDLPARIVSIEIEVSQEDDVGFSGVLSLYFRQYLIQELDLLSSISLAISE